MALDSLAERHRAEIEGQPLHANLGALVADAAARYGDRLLWVSIDGQGSPITYRDFDARANRCAGALCALGVGKGTHVGVMLPNVAPFLITWVALARLGAVTVPLNVENTPRELRYAIETANVNALVIDTDRVAAFCEVEDRAGLIPDHRVVVCGKPPAPFANDWFAMVDGASTAGVPDADVGLDDLATIQYTSGTTGLPKGCMLTQRYWLIIGKVLANRGPPVGRILLDLPLHYLGAQWRFWMALYHGSTLCVARRYSLSRLIERIHTHRIEFASFVDQAAKLPQSRRDGASCLKRISIAGLSKELHAGLEARFGAPAREGYGLTETGATLYMPFEDTGMVGSGSCGIPAPFRECTIAGPDGRPIERGATGELWVAGPGIVEGYINMPDATQAAFRGKWFRTGDLFRQDAQGYYTMVGRTRDMIRRSGENISAAEIEAVLHAMPEVRRAAAVAVPDGFRGEEVKAYLVLGAGLTPADVPPERVLAHCAARLARFKVPRFLEYVEDLPLAGPHKVAKHALTAREDARAGSYDRVDGVWR